MDKTIDAVSYSIDEMQDKYINMVGYLHNEVQNQQISALSIKTKDVLTSDNMQCCDMLWVIIERP